MMPTTSLISSDQIQTFTSDEFGFVYQAFPSPLVVHHDPHPSFISMVLKACC
jgi:hypothetical protein